MSTEALSIGALFSLSGFLLLIIRVGWEDFSILRMTATKEVEESFSRTEHIFPKFRRNDPPFLQFIHSPSLSTGFARWEKR